MNLRNYTPQKITQSERLILMQKNPDGQVFAYGLKVLKAFGGKGLKVVF